MADYSDFIKCTKEIIDEFGDFVTIRRNTSVTPVDPLKPWLGNTTSNTDYVQKGVIFGIKNEYKGDDLLRDGDRYCLIASSTIAITPNPKDRFLQNSREFEIIKVERLEPANQQILFKVFFRGQDADS